ncbi:peptidylprolyl isomerase [Ignatzschineria sp. RMDPL8A]|uniref:FKBP-type peptidyl-prolyl cis-trans isomerase n=1 Tax=Ignatzschineria sp. RMDPL8A TaxID=2999236 RepID=UPI00169BE62C|nr:peptidylprolyl isomerase [Ignatzschineria sp. RMDPL8A]MDG9729269.1 peptidylprolyl isomerase [Ignatzschineria sp. RMDPL8A]NLD08183.1 peptidylprolyl isomerase [Xanthomonadaceae bacterium]
MIIEKDQVVAVHYTLTDDNGATLDSNVGGEPLAYIHGHGMMIPGFEKALEGAKEGQEVTFTVEPEEGYGVHHEENIIDVPREAFPEDEEITVGLQVTGSAPDGSMHMFRVLEVSEEMIKLDGNHPLAGKQLHFDVEVVSVRNATAQELDHGHVHSDGHDH